MIVRMVRSFGDILAVTNILHACGKDMAMKYDIHHWDNQWLKTFLIVIVGLTKNKIFVAYDEKIVATYQTKKKGGALYFEKLAVSPNKNNKGIGSFCLRQIEHEATENYCVKVQMEVYSKSRHAIDFYNKHGYTKTGENKTLKYDVVCLEKVL